MRPTAGIALGNRYRLDRRIAVGGMGEVWVGHDLTLGRDVAVKVLRDEFAGEPGFLARFRTEARNAASLSHPNIAALFDYGEQGGSSYLVMELVSGEPLSDLLEREPVLPEARLLPVLAQTARALHAAHLAGVVHRDVKPGNILLGPGGRVKITDFGVSTAPDQAPMTATGMVMGTAQYLSPEQAVGRPATASSDLYSLGIVAYEALAGRRPFTGPTAVDIAVAHVNDPVPPLPAHVSPGLAALVMRLLAKEPTERPATAASLARALDGLMGRTPPDGHELLDTDVPRTPQPAAAGHRAAAVHPVAGTAPAAPAAPSAAPAARSAPPGARADDPPAGVDRPSPTPPSIAPPGIASPGVAPRGVVPPSYPPRRDLRDATGPRPGTTAPAAGTVPTRPASRPATGRPPTGRPVATGSDPGRPGAGRHPRSADPAAAPPQTPPQTSGRSGATRVAPAPVRTSTTTGRRLGRLGRLSWPLVALLLLLLTLLVAAVADSVGGPSPGEPTPAAGSACGCSVAPAPGPGAVDGMISGVPSAGPGMDRHGHDNS